ncbi:MAG: NADP-dependent isocitrate dehydrogenase, partial [Gemmatimonadetes bacterium]|nr:NADP-dependent isocitrate dehydrogenase [Gemmatimonadota bacterium]
MSSDYRFAKVPDGDPITVTADGLNVPDRPIVPFIEGDGMGPDIWAAAVRVFDGAVEAAYGADREIQWMEVLAGEKALERSG